MDGALNYIPVEELQTVPTNSETGTGRIYATGFRSDWMVTRRLSRVWKGNAVLEGAVDWRPDFHSAPDDVNDATYGVMV